MHTRVGWASRGLKTMNVLCLFRQNDIHETTFYPLPRLQREIVSLLWLSLAKFPPLWGTGAAIRTYFTNILTGQEYHKQKRGGHFLFEIRISVGSIHSQGTQLPTATWPAPKNKMNRTKATRPGREGTGWWSDNQAIFAVIKKSLEGWMRTGRLTYALIREH